MLGKMVPTFLLTKMPNYPLFFFKSNTIRNRTLLNLTSKSKAASLHPLFSEFRKNKFVSNNKVNCKLNSIESLLHLNTFNPGAPIICNEDGTKSEITTLSTESWPNLVTKLQGDVSLTFGYRKAFSKNSYLPLHHAVLLVTDSMNTQAIYGYNKTHLNEPSIRNDLLNTKVSRDYFFYENLSIYGDPSQTKKLLFDMEESANNLSFTGITQNCYTPIISNLLKSSDLGFKTTADFVPRLLMVVSLEENHGLGIVNNTEIQSIMQGMKHPLA